MKLYFTIKHAMIQSSLPKSFQVSKNRILCFLLLFSILVSGANLSAQSGSPDESFGINGKVTTGFGRSEIRGNTMAIQPDGKILCAGMVYNANTTREYEGDSYNSVLYRFNTDGSLDTSFGDNGRVVNKIESASNEYRVYTGIYYITVLDDGKILTYGYRGVNVQWGGLLICKYNADGSVDSSFGNNGYIDSVLFPNYTGTPMVVQSDNKIVVLGGLYFSSTSTNTASFYLQRYNEDGTLDTTFGSNGEVFTTFGYALNYPSCLALQEDGKILASGNANGRNVIARYNTDGALDNTFDGDGKVVTMFGQSNNNSFLREMPDGKIQLAGLTTTTTSTNFSISQYNSNGSLDTSFDSDGRSLAPFDANENSFVISSITKQIDGKFVVSTTTMYAQNYGNLEDFVIRRYNVDGTVDSSFGTDGKVTTNLVEDSHVSKCVLALEDGKILLVGYSSYADFNLLRYTNSGELDVEFSDDGIITERVESSNDNGRIVLMLDDGKLLLIGLQKYNTINTSGTADIAMSRYLPNGTLDDSFGVNGKSVSVFGENINNVRKAALQPDGKLLVLNEFYAFPSSNGQEVIRFNMDGSVDTSFGTNGKVSISSLVYSSLSAFHVNADGSFYVLNHGYSPIDGSEPFAFYLTSFDSNGGLNTGFGNGGTIFIEGTFYSNSDPILMVQPDGKIILAAYEQGSGGLPGIGLTRINSDGTIDDSFVNETLTTDVASAAHALFLDPDGKIIVAGVSTETNGWYVFYNFITVRYMPDGSVDNSYGTNGVVKTFLGDETQLVYSNIKSVLRQTDGKYLVGLTRIEGNPAYPPFQLYDFAIYRFNAQGGNDSNFGENGKVFSTFFTKYDELYSMALQSDNKIVLAGTTDNGLTRDFAITRLENCLNVSSELFVTLCAGETYSLNNESYSASGQYESTFTSAFGCDSLVSLNLVVLPEVSSSQNINLCSGETFTFHNETFTESGVYQTILSDMNGCDSTVTTNLFIDDLQAQIISSAQNLSVVNYPDNATFQWLDCDDNLNPISGATNSIFVPTLEGSYAVEVSNALCSFITTCEDFTILDLPSIGDESDFLFSVFPNPVQNEFILNVPSNALPCKYKIVDSNGKEISQGLIVQTQSRIPMSFAASGMYGLILEDAQGSMIMKRMVKE